ncbi:MAG TPA: bacterioferritin [Deltaproteobacteria bacterium]|nr:bacterioferritin [Deltaproteobacteria bacterium]HOI06803.1 bacterioferritin [Deltaproteobacteria bacterium]
MKGNDRVIESLNERLIEELTAINQYMVHAEMCENWGYTKLHEVVEKRAFTEMRHAEKLIARIIFLDGKPMVSKLNDIHIGQDVENQLNNDRLSEQDAIRHYNDSIRLATEVGDSGTKVLLEEILKQEEDHIDELEAQLDQISQMGITSFLVPQVG